MATSASAGYEAVRKLTPADSVALVDCGQPALNQLVERYALVNQKAHSVFQTADIAKGVRMCAAHGHASVLYIL